MLSVFFLLNKIGIDFAISIDFLTVSYVINDEYFFVFDNFFKKTFVFKLLVFLLKLQEEKHEFFFKKYTSKCTT